MSVQVKVSSTPQKVIVNTTASGEVRVSVQPASPTVVQVVDAPVTVKYAGGDVFGPASSTENALAVYGDTTGKLLENGTLTNPAANQLGGVSTVTAATSAGVTLEAANGTDVGLLGPGNTANATWYGSHNFNAATANTIAGFGASKTLESLPTSTYPSLTELSYVKGVTSSIQTQLNSKSGGPAGSGFELQYRINSSTFGAAVGTGVFNTGGNVLILLGNGTLQSAVLSSSTSISSSFSGNAGGVFGDGLGGAAGELLVNGGNGAGDPGADGGAAGTIDLTGGNADASNPGGDAGSINMKGQDAPGSPGAAAGSLDTTGTGSLGLGYEGTRTTLEGDAASDYTIVFPSAPGSVGDYLKIDSIVGTTVKLIFAP